MLTDEEFTVLQLEEGPWPFQSTRVDFEYMQPAAELGLAEKVCVDEVTGEAWWRLTDKGREFAKAVNPVDRTLFEMTGIEMGPRPPEIIPSARVMAALAQ